MKHLTIAWLLSIVSAKIEILAEFTIKFHLVTQIVWIVDTPLTCKHAIAGTYNQGLSANILYKL